VKTHEYTDEIDCCGVEDERDARIEDLRNIRSRSIWEVLIEVERSVSNRRQADKEAVLTLTRRFGA